MNIYTVHIKKNAKEPLETVEFVREGGFAIWAGFFQLFWALYKRMWLVASLLFLAQAILVAIEKSGFLHIDATYILRGAFFVYIAISANDWYRSSLSHRGYTMIDVVTARDEIEAQAKFLGSYIEDVKQAEPI